MFCEKAVSLTKDNFFSQLVKIISFQDTGTELRTAELKLNQTALMNQVQIKSIYSQAFPLDTGDGLRLLPIKNSICFQKTREKVATRVIS